MRAFVLLGLLPALCLAADEPGGHAEEKELSPRAAAVEHMLTERASPAALDKAIAEAKKQGASEQSQFEARFLFLVDRGDDEGIAALLPEMLKRKDSFKLEDSEIFAVKEDWLAVVEYVQAVDAMKKDDHEGFKKHILEAFWLSPRQGAAYAPHIEKMRMQEAMKDVSYGFDQEFEPLKGKQKVKLKEVAAGKKAVLLHFWSPWSRECEDSMPDFAAAAKEFEKHGLAVVSVVSEEEPKLLEEARAMVAKLGEHPPGTWVRDDEKQPLDRLFRVQGIPVMVLLSPEGRVLFNGSPADEALWKALSAISPEIKRPALPEDGKQEKKPAK
ncbi:TlpA family protein disulfide reductase [Luteolibacter ambystomatis]|uniref:TlpA family protein disulfide reductase n=1 Tax=Luteolibacter ambystomatis TaxID=2824561 RepID=A0A975G7U0_9BACT|nr:TlpA disulfide reductase family protein [Luteolibacter ambystomatis]QUE49885.1 TlpA family protein disulfide reductase [Luteolibacter ambystomatis]